MNHPAAPTLGPYTLACSVGGVTLRAAGGAHALEDVTRASMLRKIERNEDDAPRSLLIDAVVFAQGEAPNRAFARFTPSAARRIAKTFEGKPVLLDHDRRMASSIGRIVSSEFDGKDGTGVIRQTLQIVKRQAIADALDGTMQFFSIGFDGKPKCSICDAPFVNLGMFGTASQCEHLPGDEVETKAGKRVAEMMFADGEGLEVSAVTVPAVRETGIESIRAALSAQRAAIVRPHKERSMSILLKLVPVLGLGTDAGEDLVVEAVGKLKTERDAALVRADAGDQALKAAQTTIAAFELNEKNRGASDLQRRTDALLVELRKKVGQKLGKDGKPEQTEIETKILKLAADHGIELAEATVAQIPSAIPVGVRALSAGGDPEREPSPLTGPLTKTQRRMARSLGLSDDDYRKRLAAQNNKEA